jgi:hypothetical protein
VAWVRERIIPTEWQSLVGEVSANFGGRGCQKGDGQKNVYDPIYIGIIQPFPDIIWKPVSFTTFQSLKLSCFSPAYADRLCGLVIRFPGYRTRGSRFDSRRYQTFWEEMGLERGPLSLVSTIEELLRRNSSDAFYPQTLAVTSPTRGGRYSSLAD